MKKTFFLPAIAFFGIFALAGCGKTAEKANAEAFKDVSPNTTYKVGELVDKVTADKDGWKGKEVTVSGYVIHTSGLGGANGYVLNMQNQWSDESERYVVCKVSQGDLPEGTATKTIKVKGKIGSVTMQNYLNIKTVILDSCEIKK